MKYLTPITSNLTRRSTGRINRADSTPDFFRNLRSPPLTFRIDLVKRERQLRPKKENRQRKHVQTYKFYSCHIVLHQKSLRILCFSITTCHNEIYTADPASASSLGLQYFERSIPSFGNNTFFSCTVRYISMVYAIDVTVSVTS